MKFWYMLIRFSCNSCFSIFPLTACLVIMIHILNVFWMQKWQGGAWECLEHVACNWLCTTWNLRRLRSKISFNIFASLFLPFIGYKLWCGCAVGRYLSASMRNYSRTCFCAKIDTCRSRILFFRGWLSSHVVASGKEVCSNKCS